MEPRIQYAKTSDGVSIAFWTLGEGMPLVRMQPTPYSHALLEWSVREIRLWHEPLAQKCRLIRFDHRGTGLSQRDAIDFCLKAQINDLEAVLDRLSLDRVALMALYGSGPLAIEYASQHPERVSRLILLDAYARAPDFSIGCPSFKPSQQWWTTTGSCLRRTCHTSAMAGRRKPRAASPPSCANA